ncbi:MAG: SURF1 family cytochrome oxidase biogenesis protein [Stackebrandtia sp.]
MARRYRFLLSLRWLGLTLFGVVIVATFIWLGFWQHGRYEDRSAVNARIAASIDDDSPADVASVLNVDAAPAEAAVWSRVQANGEYDPAGEVLIRNRSLDSRVGYEVVTPLILDDGTAVLVDRGWVPAPEADATALPDVPPPPEGTVTVTGGVRSSEKELGSPNEVEGVAQARSVNVDQLSADLSYPVRDGYVVDDDPGEGLTAVPPAEQRAWQNFAYAYQWWLFALMVPVGLVMLARREAHLLASRQ